MKRLSVLAKRMVHPLRRRFYLVDYVKPGEGIVRSSVNYLPENIVGRSTAIRNVRVLAPEQRIHIGSPREDAFVPVGKLYREGSFVRPSILVCDVPDARLHVGSGMVCTRDWEVMTDIERRLGGFPKFHKRKPRQVKRLAGTYSTILGWSADNVSHWMMDCLPRIHSLAQVEPKAQVKLLMPESLSAFHRESLNCILPPNFVIEHWPDDTWLQLENFLWPSMVSGRWNFFLPPEYYEAVRSPILSRFGISPHRNKTARIYISRRRAGSRRVLNEDEVCRFLEPFGFESVDLENLSFRQQVELFSKADIIIGPHGAGLVWMLFAGEFRVVELHPTQTPRNHYHTLARGLGQEYHFLLHGGGENDDFIVNMQELEHVLRHKLRLKHGV